MSKIWPATGLIGGAFGDLDSIDGNLLADADGAVVIDPATSLHYHYTLNAGSGAAESVPDIIAPDVNPGTKRWILVPGPARNLNFISFNIAPTGVPDTEGTISWHQATKMPIVQPDIAASKLNLGLEDWTRVRNETGVMIHDGTAVFGSGIVVSPDTGELTFLVVPAAAVPGAVAIPGIVTSDIDDDSEGFAATRGDVRDYDTSGFTPLDFLYIPDDSDPGVLTNIPPSPPNYAIPVGYAKDSDVNGTIYIFAFNPIAIVNATDAAVASGDPTGFHDNDNIQVDYDPVTRKITLTGDLKYSWRGQVKELTSPWVSDAHPDILDDNYFLYSTDGETFIWATSVWQFNDLQVAFVTYNTSDKYALREPHGLMNWQAHEEFHQTVGTYKLSGGTLSDYTEASTTPADRRPNVAATNIKDEDIRTINAALTSSLYTTAFLTGGGVLDFTVDTSDIVPLNGNIPFWNEFSDPNWQQTPITNGQYMSVWLIAIPAAADSGSQKYRYLWMQGQSVGSLIGQQALFPSDLSLGDFSELFTEFIFTAQIILKFTANNWQIQEVKNLTGTRASIVGSPSGVYLSSVASDDTLDGDGTLGDPLAVNRLKVVPETVFDNGTKGVDTIINWANGAVQSITVSAIINISFSGWDSLAPTDDEKAQSGTLIIIDGDLFEPTFDDVNQGPLPTYVAGFANVQEFASLGPDGAIYNMWQVSNDQHVLLGAELITGFINGTAAPLSTLITSGVDIASGIATVGNTGCVGDSISVLTGDKFVLEVDSLVINSFTSTGLRISIVGADTGTAGVRSNSFDFIASGSNVGKIFEITADDPTAFLQFGVPGTALVDFEALGISLRKLR